MLLLIFVLLSACTQPPTLLENSEPELASSLRYLALGDSYTIGESVATEQRWPVQLQQTLLGKDFVIESPEIIAQTGWTTDRLISAIEDATPQSPYDLVSLQIGVNNQYRGYSPDIYRQEFIQLLETAIQFTGGDAQRVIVLSIPDWSVTIFALGRDRQEIADQIDLFNAITQEETARLGAHYIDITPISRLASEETDLIAADGLHPSGIMYARWVEVVLPITCEILSN